MIQDELNRFDRSLAILMLLQTRKRVTAQHLSERFSVSLRTVYRDIRSLEAAGVPIVGEAGIGYSLMEGYRLPPVMFTQEEAASFVAAEKLMLRFTDKMLGASFESAINKLKSVLRGREKDWIEALDGKVWAMPASEEEKGVPNALETLFRSIAERVQVSMEYHTLGAPKPATRHIEPVGIFYERSHWYLYAFCHLRQDYRQFRTDRIKAIQTTRIPFSRMHTEVGKRMQEPESGPRQKVVLAVRKEVMRYIQFERKYYGFVSETPMGEEVLLEFQSRLPLDGMARWYLMFGDYARVLEPESFRQTIKELAAKVVAGLNP